MEVECDPNRKQSFLDISLSLCDKEFTPDITCASDAAITEWINDKNLEIVIFDI